ncbi:hypothetical protein FWF93_03175 [Candidatus Saccharibacteria bacterium]|nr:hypothetical protein [Candidatus Saccharibacteria bacterium]
MEMYAKGAVEAWLEYLDIEEGEFATTECCSEESCLCVLKKVAQDETLSREKIFEAGFLVMAEMAMETQIMAKNEERLLALLVEIMKRPCQRCATRMAVPRRRARFAGIRFGKAKAKRSSDLDS